MVDFKDEGFIPDRIEVVFLVGCLDCVIANSENNEWVGETIQIHRNKVSSFDNIDSQHSFILVLISVLLPVLSHGVVLSLMIDDSLANEVHLFP